MADLKKLLILDDSVLISMSGNPNFVKEFPFLSNLSRVNKARGGCGRCNKSASKKVQAMNGVKHAITTLTPEKKKRLKKLLNTEQVRVRYAEAGKVREHTF